MGLRVITITEKILMEIMVIGGLGFCWTEERRKKFNKYVPPTLYSNLVHLNPAPVLRIGCDDAEVSSSEGHVN
jgi:hypothetical protein